MSDFNSRGQTSSAIRLVVALSPGNVVNCFCAANVVSVDEIFMHCFEKMLPASEPSPLDPHRGSLPGPRWELWSFRPRIAHPGKKIMRAPMSTV